MLPRNPPGKRFLDELKDYSVSHHMNKISSPYDSPHRLAPPTSILTKSPVLALLMCADSTGANFQLEPATKIMLLSTDCR